MESIISVCSDFEEDKNVNRANAICFIDRSIRNETVAEIQKQTWKRGMCPGSIGVLQYGSFLS